MSRVFIVFHGNVIASIYDCSTITREKLQEHYPASKGYWIDSREVNTRLFEKEQELKY